MIKIYKITPDNDDLVAKYNHNDEKKAIRQYIQDNAIVNPRINIFAEHSRTVYAMHFHIISEGIKEEYMLIQSDFS